MLESGLILTQCGLTITAICKLCQGKLCSEVLGAHEFGGPC
jgi:hypothetical protein